MCLTLVWNVAFYLKRTSYSESFQLFKLDPHYRWCKLNGSVNKFRPNNKEGETLLTHKKIAIKLAKSLHTLKHSAQRFTSRLIHVIEKILNITYKNND